MKTFDSYSSDIDELNEKVKNLGVTQNATNKKAAQTVKKHRAKKSQSLHTLIMRACHDNVTKLQSNISKIEKFVHNNDSIILTQNSFNQCTHFHDILHFPFEYHINSEEATTIALALWQCLWGLLVKKRNWETPGPVHLLSARTSANFTLFQQALISGSYTIIDTLITEYERYPTIYEEVLLNRTDQGYMVLQEALRTHSEQIVTRIMGELECKSEALDANLKNRTNNGFCLLADALKTHSRTITSEMLRLLKESPDKTILEWNLKSITDQKNNILHFAASCDFEIFMMIIEAFQFCYGNASVQELKKLSLLKNNKGLVPSNGRNKEIDAYLTQLNHAPKKAQSYTPGFKNKSKARKPKALILKTPHDNILNPRKGVEP